MSLTRGLFSLALVCVLAVAVSAAPSFIGPTGLLLVPTADTLNEKQFAISYFNFEEHEADTYGANYGVLPGLEVGFTHLSNDETTINFKYAFEPEQFAGTRVGLGVLDLTDETNTVLYAVATRDISLDVPKELSNFKLTFGLAGGDSAEALPLNGFFGGLSFEVGSKLTVLVEHDGEEINIGARFPLGKGFIVQGGMVGSDQNTVLGVSYLSAF